jgi:hypothetical protein
MSRSISLAVRVDVQDQFKHLDDDTFRTLLDQLLNWGLERAGEKVEAEDPGPEDAASLATTVHWHSPELVPQAAGVTGSPLLDHLLREQADLTEEVCDE